MEPLKEMFNRAYYARLAQTLSETGKFNAAGFLKEVQRDLDSLSLNQRLRRTSEVLCRYLPADYTLALGRLRDVAPLMPKGYTSLVFPDFVGLCGQGHFSESMDALKYFTSFGSSEFAVREFLKAEPQRTLKIMYKWSEDDNYHVRRLSSEGSRPRLPWSFKLPQIIADPALTAPILNNLKEDRELYVRKSVANHLNDIAKDQPGYMLEAVRKWDLQNPHTAWIVKHGSRSLIKKGDPGALALFAFNTAVKLRVQALRLSPRRLNLGQRLTFSFELVSESAKDQNLVVDYIIHYARPSGMPSAKVFKLKELELPARKSVTLSKTQLIKDFTTRKHHPGAHRLEIQVNGKVLAETGFDLLR